MANILTKRVGALSLLDAGLISVTKSVSERLLAGVIGNGTLFSGGIKAVAGAVVSKAIGGKMGDIVGTALIVDAGDDIVTSFLGSGNVSGVAGGVISGRTAGNVQII